MTTILDKETLANHHELPDIVRELTGADVNEVVGYRVRCTSWGCDDNESSRLAANCWNATMVFYGADEVRYCEADKIIAWLDETTRPVKVPKGPKYGDILVIYDPEQGSTDEITHTAVYVGDGLVWHKRSYLPKDTWRFEPLTQVLADYKDSPETYYKWRRPNHEKKTVQGREVHRRGSRG